MITALDDVLQLAAVARPGVGPPPQLSFLAESSPSLSHPSSRFSLTTKSREPRRRRRSDVVLIVAPNVRSMPWNSEPSGRRREMVIGTDLRSLATVLTALLVGFAATLVGCATAGGPVAVSDIKTVTGTWEGIVYPNSELDPDRVTLTIRDDGSYDVVSAARQTIGTSRGRGTIVIRDGRLIMEAERGRGEARLLKDRDGNLMMIVDATLSDNTTLSVQLSPSK